MLNRLDRQATARLSPRVAFYLQASIVVFFLAASSAPTPLYAVYQAHWDLSPITVTIIFGIYALAVLTSLLTVGSLSDYVGRRPVLLVALAVQAMTMIIFANASGLSALLLARALQGLATGAAVGAVGAGMLDLDKARGTIANAIAPLTGTATGALGASLLVEYLPAPTRLVYFLLLGIFVALMVGVALMAETVSPKAGAWASLRPKLAAPSHVKASLFLAVPALIAAWALAGFYGSLGPALAGIVTGSSSRVPGGLALFTIAASGGAAVILLRRAAPRLLMTIGLAGLLVGVGITLSGVALSSTAVFFLGTAISGVGFGGSFQGGLRIVLPAAAPHQRAGVLSTLWVVSYLALGLPAVIGGFLTVYAGGVLTAATDYGLGVIALAGLALLGQAVILPAAKVSVAMR